MLSYIDTKKGFKSNIMGCKNNTTVVILAEISVILTPDGVNFDSFLVSVTTPMLSSLTPQSL